jgi:hypothetical protein
MDFIMDDETWELVYLVVDTRNWFRGKKVLVPVRHIKQLLWDNSQVLVDVSIDSVRNSIPFDASEFFHPEDINSIHDNPNIHIK